MGYEVTWESKGVVKRFFGGVTNDDLMQSSATVQGDARFDDLQYVILDFSNCDFHTITEPALLEIAAIDEAATENWRSVDRRKIRMAIVATDAGIIRLAKQYASYQLKVVSFAMFFNLSDARNWLAQD